MHTFNIFKPMKFDADVVLMSIFSLSLHVVVVSNTTEFVRGVFWSYFYSTILAVFLITIIKFRKHVQERIKNRSVFVSLNTTPSEFYCIICQTSDPGEIVRMSQCNHVYHASCITGWLNVNHRCAYPSCPNYLDNNNNLQFNNLQFNNLRMFLENPQEALQMVDIVYNRVMNNLRDGILQPEYQDIVRDVVANGQTENNIRMLLRWWFRIGGVGEDNVDAMVQLIMGLRAQFQGGLRVFQNIEQNEDDDIVQMPNIEQHEDNVGHDEDLGDIDGEHENNLIMEQQRAEQYIRARYGGNQPEFQFNPRDIPPMILYPDVVKMSSETTATSSTSSETPNPVTETPNPTTTETPATSSETPNPTTTETSATSSTSSETPNPLQNPVQPRRRVRRL